MKKKNVLNIFMRDSFIGFSIYVALLGVEKVYIMCSVDCVFKVCSAHGELWTKKSWVEA